MTTLYIDADACPVKDEVYKVATRYQLPVFVVSNSWIRTPTLKLITQIVVDEGPDVADDWIPVYDRTSLAGFYVAIGTSGNQFKNAPLAGRFLAALVTACENGHDHDADPVRYTAPFTTNEINLGHYSRLREPHAESDGNVMG